MRGTQNQVRWSIPAWRLVWWIFLIPALGVAAQSAEPGRSRLPADAEGPPPFADSQQAEEDRRLRAEQLDAARELYREYPQSDALPVLGVVHFEQGDLEGAIRFWEEALRLEPGALRLHGRAQTLSNLGDALRTRGEFPRAETMLREALRVDLRRQDARQRLAQLLYDQDRLEESLAVLDEDNLKTPPAHLLRGQTFQRLERMAEAKRSLEEAIRLDPALVQAYYGLAMTCARLGDQAKADEYRQQFATLRAAQQESGRVIRRLYDPLHSTRQSVAQTHTQVAWVYEAQGRLDKAEALWKRAAAIDPADTACRFHLLMLYQKGGRNQDGLEVCREMIQAEPANAMHHISLGNFHVRLQQRPEAEAAYRKATELAPNRPEPCFALAQFYLQGTTNLAEAVRLAQRAVDLAPAAPHYFMLGRALARIGDRPGALAASEKACELAPGNPQYERLRTSLQHAP